MIVAGFGCRRGASEAEARAAYDAAGVTATALATGDRKADEPGLRALARTLGLPLLGVSVEAMRATPAVTVSQASLREAGVASVAECSALAAAGPDARLIVPRVVVGPVTCAIASADADGLPPGTRLEQAPDLLFSLKETKGFGDLSPSGRGRQPTFDPDESGEPSP